MLDLEAMAAAQSHDEELQQLSTSTTSLHLEHVPILNSNHSLLCDVSQGHLRPLVPSTMRRDIFNNINSLSNPGIKASRHLVAERTCHNCQQSKIQRHVKAPIQAFPTPDSRFDSIHVDIVGPLPPSKGYTYLFTCIDRYTR